MCEEKKINVRQGECFVFVFLPVPPFGVAELETCGGLFGKMQFSDAAGSSALDGGRALGPTL